MSPSRCQLYFDLLLFPRLLTHLKKRCPLEKTIEDFCQDHQLPSSFLSTISEYYQPLSEHIYKQLSKKPYLLGINGAQGTGKSTLADFIAVYLQKTRGIRTACLSIDDLYLPQEQRQKLARSLHPLFATRGVPGTHDVALGIATIKALQTLNNESLVRIPRFNKATDNRHPEINWTSITGPIDLIIFEGWCVGSKPVQQDELDAPINKLEEQEDPKGIWRNRINQNLKDEYQTLFENIDSLILLQAPNFDAVYQWRLEQEQKLADKYAQGRKPSDSSGIMSAAEIARFIQHYERITHANIRDLSPTADVLIKLQIDHQINSITYR